MVMKAAAVVRGARPRSRTGRPGEAKPRLVVPGPAAQPFTQALARELAAGAVARLRLRPLRGHRRARLRPRPARTSVSRSRSSASATTSSTAARSPCSPWSRRSAGSCPASSATPSRSSRSRTRTACSSTPSTPSPLWNGREVPPVLLSGNHAAIAAWRHEQRLARTAARRPDLLHASHGARRQRRRRSAPPRRATCRSSPS